MNKNKNHFIETEFSIVIPAYNRAWCIERAIRSAVTFLRGQSNSEILVVDDGSKDGTQKIVNSIFEKLDREDIGTDFFLIEHKVNLGVCAAKNTGARSASGKWLVFLDSDDELVADSFGEVKRLLQLNEDLPLHFFRCIDGNSSIIASPSKSKKRNFIEYLNYGTDGEALPIIKRNVFLKFPYDEDISGYESLSYMRIVRNFKYACIHSLIARRYHVSHDDRLSVKNNFKKRSGTLAKGHLRVLSEHFSKMTNFIIFKYVLRFLKMKFVSFQIKFFD